MAEIGQQIIPPSKVVRERRFKAEAEFDAAVTRGDIKQQGVTPPQYIVFKEQHEHTIMLWMKASGKSDKEICEKCGYEYQHFKMLQRQPWWLKRFNEIVESCGRDAVEQFIEGEVLPCLQTLRDIRDDPAQRGSTRVAAANSILDRGLGKATVRIETKDTTNTDEATTEIETLRKQVEANARRIAAGQSFIPSSS